MDEAPAPRPTTEEPPEAPELEIAAWEAEPKRPTTPDKDSEPLLVPADSFARNDAFRIGLMGGKGVGKSYLFQAMVYRALAGHQAGALSYFLEKDAPRLTSSIDRRDEPKPENLARFLAEFSSWNRLAPTTMTSQKWFRLHLGLRAGWLGGARCELELDYFDGSGESFFEDALTDGNRSIWLDGFVGARIAIVCLPLWVAFPRPELADEQWRERERRLQGFEQVVQNFAAARRRLGRTQPVETVLALTMADDPRGNLAELRDRWIAPYVDSPESYLAELRTVGGVARYLANARLVSARLRDRLASLRDPFVSGIPQKLDFGRGEPWLVPVSAIDGTRLDRLESSPLEPHRQRALGPPVPVHVELPLLVALCSSTNALF